MSYESDRNPADYFTNAMMTEDGVSALTNAILAMAAELRTQNLIAYRVAAAGPLANFSNETLRPIRQRLGLDQ